MRVFVGPGATAFTRTPCGPSARAQAFVRFSSPAFVTPYQRSGCPVNAATELTLTIRPLRRSLMRGATAAIKAAGASRFTARISRRCSSAIASTGSQKSTAALLTSASISPIEFTIPAISPVRRRSKSMRSPTTSPSNSLSSDITRHPARERSRGRESDASPSARDQHSFHAPIFPHRRAPSDELLSKQRHSAMNAADFRRIALSLNGVEEYSHAGLPAFRVGGRKFASLASQSRGLRKSDACTGAAGGICGGGAGDFLGDSWRLGKNGTHAYSPSGGKLRHMPVEVET